MKTATSLGLDFRLAARYLGERKLRTALTTLAIFLGVMIMFGLNAMLPAISEAFRQNVMAAAGEVDLTVTSETRGAFDARTVDTVLGTPGVARAMGSLTRSVILPPATAPKGASGQPINSLIVVGVDPATVQSVRPLTVAEGRGLAPGDGDVVLVTDRLAGAAGLRPGDTLHLPSAEGVTAFQVTGIVSGQPSLGTDQVYVPLEAAQRLFGLPGQINAIDAVFAPGSEQAAVRQAVLDRLGGGFRSGGLETGSELMAALRMGQLVFAMFGLLALAMGGFIIYNTFRTSVVERRRDIGMLRALGASRRTVLGVVLAESLIQGIAGTATGMLAGYGLVVAILNWLGPTVRDLLRMEIASPKPAPGAYATAIGLGLGVTLVGAISPALAATRMTPLEALRPARPEAPGKATRRRVLLAVGLALASLAGLVSGRLALSAMGAILFLVALLYAGPLLVSPVSRVFGRLLGTVLAREGRVARSNLERQPGRAAVTASTVMIGLAILVSVGGLSSTLSAGMIRYVDTALGTADYVIMPQSLFLGGGNVGAGPGLAAAVREVPGVASVTTLRLGTTAAEGLTSLSKPGLGKAGGGATEASSGVGLQVVGIDPATYPQLAGLVFSAGDPAEAYARLGSERAIIVNAIFASANRLRVGQELTLATPEGAKAYQVVGVANDFLNAKLATGYISQANLAADFHETADLMVLAGLGPGADPAAVQRSLEGIVEGYPAFSLFPASEWRDTVIAQIQASMSLLYVIVIFLAIPSLIALVNTLGINVIERTREIGVLRAVGATRRQVRRIILGESLLLAAAGTAYGLLSGLWLGYVLAGALNVGGFPMPYYFPYAAALATIAAGLLFGVVGALIPARQAARLNVVTALQYE